MTADVWDYSESDIKTRSGSISIIALISSFSGDNKSHFLWTKFTNKIEDKRDKYSSEIFPTDICKISGISKIGGQQGQGNIPNID